MDICRYTSVGMPINFKKSEEKKCINCEYKQKKFFKKEYKCQVILGLDVGDGNYGYCLMYDREK
jgi:hypothetical protein